LLLAVACTSLFALLAVLVEADTFIIRLDANLVRTLYSLGDERPTLQAFFVFVTDLGTGRPLWIVGALAVLLLLVSRQWFRALVWLTGLLASEPVTAFLKAQFGRPRPPFATIDGFSFPSGHAFGSSVTYGMLALTILFVFREHRWRWLLAGALWLWMGLVALSRPILGVHYPSDVLAGMSLGLGWGFAWAALAEWRDLQKQIRHRN
jgi:undecaprenyl-diphosphatase